MNINTQINAKLTRSIERTFAELEAWMVSMQDYGMSDDMIKELLEADLKVGGRLFGEFRTAIKRDVIYSIDASMAKAMIDTYKESGIELFEWSIESDNPCPDCLDRESEPPRPMEYWEAVGLPKSGFSVCRDNCKCRLVAVK